VEAKDWTAAMDIVDQEIAHAPKDMDIRAWRARVLMWSGKIAEAEREYLEILAIVPNDPDNWMGLANVYSREAPSGGGEAGSGPRRGTRSEARRPPRGTRSRVASRT